MKLALHILPSKLAVILVAGILLAACNRPATYIDVTGGGFIFNYRLGMAFAGLIVVRHADLPANSHIEVMMEDPAGGQPLVMKQSPAGGRQTEFTTEPLKGIVANKEYAVSVRLVAADGTDLQRIDKKFKSELDQSILPSEPLTVGPGYTPNPGPPAMPEPNRTL